METRVQELLTKIIADKLANRLAHLEDSVNQFQQMACSTRIELKEINTISSTCIQKVDAVLKSAEEAAKKAEEAAKKAEQQAASSVKGKPKEILKKAKTNDEKPIRSKSLPKAKTTEEKTKPKKENTKPALATKKSTDTSKKSPSTAGTGKKVEGSKKVIGKTKTLTKEETKGNDVNLTEPASKKNQSKMLFKKEPETKISISKSMEENFIRIAKFADKSTLLALSEVNKTYRKAALRLFYTREEEIKNQANEMVQEQVSVLTEAKLQEDIPEFTITRGTLKAVEILNTDNYKNIFNEPSCNLKILIVYRIYAFLFYKNEINPTLDNARFWEQTRMKFLKMAENDLGISLNSAVY